tara:strand:+ start:53 stop:742 length:690 start_codon:yes stop_codon:yes gene_type:complete
MKLYEGKSKIIYSANSDSLVRVHFKDDATAFNGEKKEILTGKGELNCKISTFFMKLLANKNIPVHFIESITNRDQICYKLNIIPIEVVVRNFAAGSICRRYGIEKGLFFDDPLCELFYKSDELNDPFVSDDHAIRFGWATEKQLDIMKKMALKINTILKDFWKERGIDLVDFKVEFGTTVNGDIVLGDEITPDGCRLWSSDTGKVWDKDVFRHELGDLVSTYDELTKLM